MNNSTYLFMEINWECNSINLTHSNKYKNRGFIYVVEHVVVKLNLEKDTSKSHLSDQDCYYCDNTPIKNGLIISTLPGLWICWIMSTLLIQRGFCIILCSRRSSWFICQLHQRNCQNYELYQFDKASLSCLLWNWSCIWYLTQVNENWSQRGLHEDLNFR